MGQFKPKLSVITEDEHVTTETCNCSWETHFAGIIVHIYLELRIQLFILENPICICLNTLSAVKVYDYPHDSSHWFSLYRSFVVIYSRDKHILNKDY